MRDTKTVELLLIASHTQRDKQEHITFARVVIFAAAVLIITGLAALTTGAGQ